jgi:hypothetical protein
MHLKSIGYMETVLFPTIANAVNVQSPDMVSWISTAEKIRYSKPAANIVNYWSLFRLLNTQIKDCCQLT